MLVENCMTKDPVTVDPDDWLSRAACKMQGGGFRRLPVVKDGKLIGVITDRDLREQRGHWQDTRVNAVMNRDPLTVGSKTTVEEAAQIMLENKIGGLPVLDDGRLVGIITASDVLQAFLNLMGAAKGGSTRIDFILEGEEHGLVEASRAVAREGGEILGIGTYRGTAGANPICYLRVAAADPDGIAKSLRQRGFEVLGVHRIGGAAR
jgi:acetoin utilization protein AcuB